MARFIKRYDNRKLYDTEQKRYISLEEIALLVRGGEQVVVTDNATGADISSQTLAKVLLEAESGALPQPQFLHELLRAGGRVAGLTVRQFERGLDRLIEASLERLSTVREVREEMARLKDSVARLENAINTLKLEEQHGNNTHGSAT